MKRLFAIWEIFLLVFFLFPSKYNSNSKTGNSHSLKEWDGRRKIFFIYCLCHSRIAFAYFAFSISLSPLYGCPIWHAPHPPSLPHPRVARGFAQRGCGRYSQGRASPQPTHPPLSPLQPGIFVAKGWNPMFGRICVQISQLIFPSIFYPCVPFHCFKEDNLFYHLSLFVFCFPLFPSFSSFSVSPFFLPPFSPWH